MKTKKQKTVKEHVFDIHVNTALMSMAALLTVFHLQLEYPHKKHELEAGREANAIVDPSEISGLFEREREVHPTHGQYGRTRTVNVTGS